MKAFFNQQGIALITVLLVLAIATVAMVSMSSSRQLDIRRTENLMRAAQAFEYLYGLESWAADTLQNDAANNNYDSFADEWTKTLESTPIQGGAMSAELTDLQGRFNLNNLLVDDKPSELDVKRFQRLLSLLKINPKQVDAILDWIDADMEIRYPDGAEDESYLRQKTPYRSANRLFADVSELLLIQGITRDDYEKLTPYIYVTDSYAPINVNTADALLIQSLADKLTKSKTDSLIRAIRNEPFEKIEDFLKQDELAESGVSKQGLGVTSQDFLLSGRIEAGKQILMFSSQLKRAQSGQTSVVKRQRRSSVNG
ncbi:MAG: type II secretion system minor pseudopilin GspK [Methylovulum sp.]